MEITLERVRQLIGELREDYQREEDQAILQQRLDKATAALAGKDACARIERRLEIWDEMGLTRSRLTAVRRR